MENDAAADDRLDFLGGFTALDRWYDRRRLTSYDTHNCSRPFVIRLTWVSPVPSGLLGFIGLL